MTILDAIQRIDNLKPNGVSQSQKIKWLSSLDGIVKEGIIDTHEDGENISFKPYDDTDITTELLIPAPYDDVYIHWLEAQIDYTNGETGRYQNSMNMYNTAYSAFERYYNRTHMPIGKKFTFGGQTESMQWQTASGIIGIGIKED